MSTTTTEPVKYDPLFSHSRPSVTPQAECGKRVVGYYTSWETEEITREKLRKLTHVIYLFVVLNDYVDITVDKKEWFFAFAPLLRKMILMVLKFSNERDSTVFISFGSVIQSSQMPENFKAGLIHMFESFPNVTFIWKYEKDDVEFLKSLPNNVHLKKWVPQPALLADKRVKVFVTHGGLGSTMEVAYSGKPALI